MAEQRKSSLPIAWGYGAADGPERWGSLAPEFAACSLGREQSPIDLADAESRPLPEIAFDYAPGPVSVLHDGHNLVWNFSPGSAITVSGKRFDLQQFHLHHPGEHTVEGAGFPLELHLVHADSKGALAVVGVFLREGESNRALAPVWRELPEDEAPPRAAGVLNPRGLLPGSRTTWRYRGSLTTPPCSEGVSWFVMTEPVAVSREQVEAFRRIVGRNARPPQPRNGRELVTDRDR